MQEKEHNMMQLSLNSISNKNTSCVLHLNISLMENNM